jgi:hypothetical protein
MAARLSITMDEALYRRLEQERAGSLSREDLRAIDGALRITLDLP